MIYNLRSITFIFFGVINLENVRHFQVMFNSYCHLVYVFIYLKAVRNATWYLNYNVHTTFIVQSLFLNYYGFLTPKFVLFEKKKARNFTITLSFTITVKLTLYNRIMKHNYLFIFTYKWHVEWCTLVHVIDVERILHTVIYVYWQCKIIII